MPVLPSSGRLFFQIRGDHPWGVQKIPIKKAKSRGEKAFMMKMAENGVFILQI